MLTLSHVTKSFGATRALDEVSLTAGSGEIVGIVGENGAGKTTLMRIIAGELPPDAGSVEIHGHPELVHQHFMLVSNFSIAENLALNDSSEAAAHAAFGKRPRLLRTRRQLERDAEEIIERSGIPLAKVGRRVDELSVGERSRLELIKAISKNPEILILDEPTSVLTPSESEELFRVVERLAAAGTTVLFISHKLREVLAVAQRIVVMRGGRVVAETTPHAMTAEDLAKAMVGDRSIEKSEIDAAVGASTTPLDGGASLQRQSVPSTTPATRRAAAQSGGAPAALRCDRLWGSRIEDLTLDINPGEIVAIVGVAGNGQSELAAMLRGIVAPRSGAILLDGKAATARGLLRSARIGHIPEDRTRDGIVPQLSIAENIALAARWPIRHANRLSSRLVELYSIRARSSSQTAGSLSGGNQQKVVLARELDRRPAVIVAAEPTRGLDIAATRFVHEQLRLAAAAGSGILLITSDLDEAFALARAIHVIYRGRLSERLSPADAAPRIGGLMAGVA